MMVCVGKFFSVVVYKPCGNVDKLTLLFLRKSVCVVIAVDLSD